MRRLGTRWFALTVVAAAFLWDNGGLSVGSDSGSLYADEVAQASAAEAAKSRTVSSTRYVMK